MSSGDTAGVMEKKMEAVSLEGTEKKREQPSMKKTQEESSKNHQSSKNHGDSWRNRGDSSSKTPAAPNKGDRDRTQSCNKPNTQQASKSNTENEQQKKSRSRPNSQRKSFNKDEDASRNRQSHRHSTRTCSQTSNGENSDAFSVGDLEEPFSSDEEEEQMKPNLPMPMLKCRTLSGTWPETGFSPTWGGPTMCVSCLTFFNLPSQLEECKQHLLKEHKIVIDQFDLIVDHKRYVEHWRKRFSKESIDKLFPRIVPTKDDPHYAHCEFYYHITTKVEEDAAIRRDLALRRLEEVLSCQQRERDDREFKLGCIFCRYVARGNRSKMIHHLYMIHKLNIGKPDNLVFVREYIEHLKDMLTRNQCICCEKTFADKTTLMEHMRKRQHKEVNPKNNFYDKFYVINYLEVGKRWTDVLAEDFEDSTTAFQDSDEEDEVLEWDEWEKDNILDDTRVVCLMCGQHGETLEGILDHMQQAHNFNLPEKVQALNLDTYQRMKLINYIRVQNFNGTCWICREEVGNPMQLVIHMQEKETPFKELPPVEVWDKEENLIPMFGNDNLPWLLESYLMEQDEKEEQPSENKIAELIKESKQNYIEGVIPEDMPDLDEINKNNADLASLL